MESRFLWLVLLQCLTLHKSVNCEVNSKFGIDAEEFLFGSSGADLTAIPESVEQSSASGDLEIESGDSTEKPRTSSPGTTSTTNTSKGRSEERINDLTVRFPSPTSFIVNWDAKSGSNYTVVIYNRGNNAKVHEKNGLYWAWYRLNTSTVPLESFREYTVTVVERKTDARSTVSFWSPPEPPSMPSLKVSTSPNKVLVKWEAPSRTIRALLEYKLQICVNFDFISCRMLTMGANTQSLSLTTPRIANYTVRLWARHRYVFGDFVVDSETQQVTVTSCRNNSTSEIALHYDSTTQKVGFLFAKGTFSDICELGSIAKLGVEWREPQDSFTCDTLLQHRNWKPSSADDPFGCEIGDPGYWCSFTIEGSQLQGYENRQIVIKASDAKSRCAFVRSNVVLTASFPSGAPHLPWIILAVLVSMTTLGLLYKKREPLWTFASDIINTFNKNRSRYHNDVELARFSFFKIRNPGEATRFNEEYFQKKRDMNYLMSHEYEQIQVESERLMADRSFGLQPELRLKNRYKNVIPFNHNRVTLQPQNGEVLSTYINASLVKGFNGRAKCIVCQGPKVESLEDFLRMIIEYDVNLIASLLSTINIDTDQDKHQCSQYWPREVGASEEFGKYSVKLESESQYDCFVRRNLKISGPGASHRVTQLHFFRWPDHKTPNKSEDLLTFLSVFRKLRRGTPVIHCSAGVGRSGTLVALDILMDLLEVGERPDISRVVAHLRTQRVLMIQTEQQYIFLYDCIYAALNGKSDMKYLNNYLTQSI